MLDKVKNWALEGDMNGFDTLASEQVGQFDYMSLLKGVAGIASGAGGMMSAQQGVTAGTPGMVTPASTELERIRIQAQIQAESSARTWKIVGGIALAVLGIGTVALIARPAKVA
jgi:hypothetical protein